MKRSKAIRLVLIGTLSAGVTSCDPGGRPVSVSTDQVYTNNHHVPGVGYYHAPFRDWYPFQYNHRDPQTQRYFHGGQWTLFPHESITNVSSPTVAATQRVHAQRTDIARGGFGNSSHRHGVWS